MSNIEVAIERFINPKISSYIDPARKGVPKGQAVGLFRKKYHAALTAALPVSLQARAKIAGVSYGTLRKWRTEEVFRNAEASARKEISTL